MSIAALAQLPFTEACESWLESRRYHLAPRTFEGYGHHIKTLGHFFKEMKLPEITGDQMRAYQHARSSTAGHGAINKELGIIIQIRKRIGLPLLDYQRIPVPKDYEAPGRALSEEEEERLVRVCKAAIPHPTWDVAALATLLSMFSGLAPCELLSLKLKHCSVRPPSVTVPRAGAKRQKRERIVTLNEEAAAALIHLIERAAKKCEAASPEHYLFPFQNKDHSFDPTKPARGWRTGLEHLLDLAEIKMRRYDCRHHAISKALRNPKVSKQGALDYFGWINPKMFGTYFHGDLATLNVVAAAIVKKPPKSVDIRKLLKTFQQNRAK